MSIMGSIEKNFKRFALIVGILSAVVYLSTEFNMTMLETGSILVLIAFSLLIYTSLETAKGIDELLEGGGGLGRKLNGIEDVLREGLNVPKTANDGGSPWDDEKVETSGGGAFGGMILGGALGLAFGPAGVLVGGILGALAGDKVEEDEIKDKRKKYRW